MTDKQDFSTIRAAWVAKGRPADLADPYWASVVAQAERVAEFEAAAALRAPASIFGYVR